MNIKKTFVGFTFLLFCTTIFSQISVKDSTVQVIGYWANLEQQSYDISLEKLKLKGTDTISREYTSYEVDLKIIDSTANSYTTEWYYKNYKVETDSEIAKKINALASDIAVQIKTDEFGTFMEVVNWESIKEYQLKVTDQLKEELKDVPNINNIIDNVMKNFNSKEAIEANAIKDAIQFYSFHGIKYTLNEKVKGNITLRNNFGGKPFDAAISYSLDEINEEDGNAVIRMKQVVNSEQLTNETYKFLKKVSAFGKNMPNREDFPPLTNETYTASRIHGETGWVIYSIETKEVKAEGTTKIEERIIEIK
ncbi:hypothetical protein [uncultured Polaribacter sp.]|uniref:hypothetical protein n=1 Tax=uncultured Polaribacter sp. TaxID=174711 RepID=UPI002624A38E|nr:hypothetical protein [uncultured Polaribacter sp.]